MQPINCIQGVRWSKIQFQNKNWLHWKKKKEQSVLLIECKAGSFNVIMFQFYSQSFFQDFLTRSEASSHNNALLRDCQERQSLQAHFPIIILTSLKPQLWQHISCGNRAQYENVYISAFLTTFCLYASRLRPMCTILNKRDASLQSVR